MRSENLQLHAGELLGQSLSISLNKLKNFVVKYCCKNLASAIKSLKRDFALFLSAVQRLQDKNLLKYFRYS